MYLWENQAFSVIKIANKITSAIKIDELCDILYLINVLVDSHSFIRNE